VYLHKIVLGSTIPSVLTCGNVYARPFLHIEMENALLNDELFLTNSVTKASKSQSLHSPFVGAYVTMIPCTLGVQSVEISQQKLSQTTQ
jgi:hypothetical protein